MDGAPDEEFVKVCDPDGCQMKLTQIDGVYSLPMAGIKQKMAQLQKFQGRDDDILILAYPKSGTHWTWEIAQLLSKNQTENVVDAKMKEFLEYADLESIDKASSPRILNTHLRPRFFPPDSINRKCKIIYVVRNPKDVMVSFYHHCEGMPVIYEYHGSFSGFFHMAMSGHIESGSWFDYTLEHEEFFKSHPDIPVLRLYYEDMKKDLLSNVRRIADFCGYRVSEETIRGITDACTFSNMKTVKTKNIDPKLGKSWRDGKYNMFRKGVSGDWKNYFTVAQNEQFEEEAARRLAGSDVEVRWVN